MRIFLLIILCGVFLISCQENETNKKDISSYIEMGKYDEKNTVLSIHINRVPSQKINSHVFLYQYKETTFQVVDSIELKKINSSASFLIDTSQKGMYNLGEDYNANIIVGNEDTIVIYCNYETLTRVGDVEVVSNENKYYKNALQLSKKEFKERKKIIDDLKKINSSELERKKRIQLENHWKLYNHKLDSIALLVKGSYLSEIMIPIFKTPVRNIEEPFINHDAYLFKNYFNNILLGKEELLHTPFFSQFIIYYLNHYKGNSDSDYSDGAYNLLMNKESHSKVQESIRNIFIDYYVQNEKPDVAKEIAMIGEEGCSDEILAEIEAEASFYKGLSLNEKIPNIQVENFNLYQELSKAKKTFLYFWRNGCSSCEAEHLALKKNIQQLKNNNIKVIGFALTEEKEELKKEVEKFEMNWENISDFKGLKTPYISQFKIKSTPATYLIDQDGLLLQKQISILKLMNEVK